MKNRLYGIALTIFLACMVLIIFLGSVITNLNSTFFSPAGDGFKAYYGAIYHVEYDSLVSRTNAMHYPFGEMTAFTDSQPLVSNAVKWISSNIVDISGGIIGIINGLMLLSFVLCALFIFLIFMEMKVGWWFGAIAAAGISMLSPQVARLGGHFSLSWQVWIPLMIYLLIRFHRSRTIWLTLLIGLTVFLAGKMHLYFLGFYGFMIGGYWFWRFMRYKHTTTYWYRDVLTIFLQFLLPVLLIQVGIMLNDEVADRTAFPYGFYVFLGHPAAVFLPSGQPWAFISRYLTVFNHISWEAISYVGLSGLAGIVTAFVLWIIRLIKKEKHGRLTESMTVTVLFWVSVAALIFSFGVPFIFGLESWVDIIGPVRQLRALGRFAWLFYYLLNMVVFASLFRLAFHGEGKLVWKITAFAALAMLIFEGSWNMQRNTGKLNNQIAELADKENLMEENQWVKQINTSDYQAIIPVPYFHVGSESIWIDSKNGAKEAAMLASLKTGLPITGSEMSRTSISQTFMNYSLFTEPLQRMEVTDFLESNKPFLVQMMKGYETTETDKWLLRNATPLTENSSFTLLSLPVSEITSLHETWRRHIFEKYDSAELYPINQLMVSDTSAFFRHVSFDDLPSSAALKGNGAFTYPAREWRPVYEDTLKGVPAGRKILMGFWVYKYYRDGYLRGHAEVIQKNVSTGETTNYIYSDVFRHLKAFQDDWALIEIEIETKSPDEVVKFSIRNTVLPKADYVIDELLVREKELDIWEITEQGILYNGRKFVKR